MGPTLSKLLLSRFTISVVGLFALAAMVAIHVYFPRQYWLIMKFMIFGPAPRPFVDWEWIPAAIRCWAEGVNVFEHIPCYEIWPHLGFNYSPLWLNLTFLQAGAAWVNATMLAVIALFCLSLATLPPPRTLRSQVILVLSALSPAAFLGFERGNADLIIFLLVMMALNLSVLALPARLVGYALLTFAGLLKFYPFVALILVLRERVCVLIAVALASGAALATLILAYHQELRWMAGNLPGFPDIHVQFIGAENLAVAIGVATANILGAIMDPGMARATGVIVARGVQPILGFAALLGALAVARRCDLADALARLSTRQRNYLIVGAALLCGCFFAIQNVIYRGIFVLLVLPGLMALSGQMTSRLGRRLFGAVCMAVPFALWKRFFDMGITAASHWSEGPFYGVDPYVAFPGLTLHYLLWIANELIWWGLIVLLLAVLGAFTVRSPVWALLCRIGVLPPGWAPVRHG